MDTYTTLRTFAGSWALVALTLFFVGVILFVFRPGAARRQHDAATAIFRNDDRPAADTATDTDTDTDTQKEART